MVEVNTTNNKDSSAASSPLIGVLALQGAFVEHQRCLEEVGCRTTLVKTPKEMEGLDGIVLPGGESTAMGLIGTGTKRTVTNVVSVEDGTKTVTREINLWESLKEFSRTKPTWGTCAGMILLSERCVGASAVIENGQALVGGLDMLVCRNYFGSQVSSFEIPTPSPPGGGDNDNDGDSFPGVFIRAPAILSVGSDVSVLGKVVATPCRQAAVVLDDLEQKIIAQGGEDNVMKVMGVVDALAEWDKSAATPSSSSGTNNNSSVILPGATVGTKAREIICAARRGNLLCTAFHPELTDDYRWHEYFKQMVIQIRDDANKND